MKPIQSFSSNEISQWILFDTLSIQQGKMGGGGGGGKKKVREQTMTRKTITRWGKK
jgi:hypothetical protein